MSSYTIEGRLSAALVPTASFSVAYPAGTGAATFANVAKSLVMNQAALNPLSEFSVVFGVGFITIGNSTTRTYPVGSKFILVLDPQAATDSAWEVADPDVTSFLLWNDTTNGPVTAAIGTGLALSGNVVSADVTAAQFAAALARLDALESTLPVATPVFSPAAGTYAGTQGIAISCATAGSSIYYTTDGSTPTNLKTLYTGTVSVPASITLKAIAYKAGMTTSSVATAAFVITANYDATQNFETGLAGLWSEYDPGFIIATSGAAKKNGSFGMLASSATVVEGHVLYTLAVAKSSLVYGFWYKTGSYASFSGDKFISEIKNNGQGDIVRILEGRSSGDNTRRLTWSLSAAAITVTDNTWYWVTMKFVQNGTCQLAIYDTSFAQVGSTLSASATNFACDTIAFGTYGVASSTDTYFDDIKIDLTTGTFPIPAS